MQCLPLTRINLIDSESDESKKFLEFHCWKFELYYWIPWFYGYILCLNLTYVSPNRAMCGNLFLDLEFYWSLWLQKNILFAMQEVENHWTVKLMTMTFSLENVLELCTDIYLYSIPTFLFIILMIFLLNFMNYPNYSQKTLSITQHSSSSVANYRTCNLVPWVQI